MLMIVLALIFFVLFIEGVMGKRIMFGKKGPWLVDKKSKRP
jgi:hypothetical protein